MCHLGDKIGWSNKTLGYIIDIKDPSHISTLNEI